MEPGRPFVPDRGRAWVDEQLQAAGYKQSGVAHIVGKALSTIEPYASATPEDTKLACQVLTHLLVGMPIPEELWTTEQQEQRLYTWIPALPRSLHPGDKVRVRHDAYPQGSPGYAHNGREGTVMAIRRGIIVGYTGTSTGIRHEIERLERQVPLRRDQRRQA